MFCIMDFTTLPPEVISALIHSGPGSESLADAAAAWRQLGADLEDAADNYAAAVSSMADTWHGPSSAAMSQSVAPYLTWLRTTSQQAQQVAASAQAAASAFNSASAAVVPTAQVLANRTRLAQLLATNGFGRNLPAIAATEADYQQHVGEQRGGDDPLSGRLDAGHQPAAVHLAGLDHEPVGAGHAEQCADRGGHQLGKLGRGARRRGRYPGGRPSRGAVTPTTGYVGLANTYANQFISSGFPINLLSYLAQSQSAQALQGVSAQVGQGVSEGEEALGGAAADLGGGAAGALGALGPAGEAWARWAPPGFGDIDSLRGDWVLRCRWADCARRRALGRCWRRRRHPSNLPRRQRRSAPARLPECR